MKSERQIQTAILRFLRSLGKLCWVIKVEICNERGVPDILCCYRGRFAGFEVKTAKGKISGPQRVQMQRIRRACGRAVVVRSVADVQVVMEKIDAECEENPLPPSPFARELRRDRPGYSPLAGGEF